MTYRPVPLLELAAAQKKAAASSMPGPWETLIISIVAHRAKRKALLPLSVLFTIYPNAEALAKAEPSQVADILYGVADYERKAKNIVTLSEIWSAGDFTDVRDLPGVTMRVTEDIIRCLDAAKAPSGR